MAWFFRALLFVGLMPFAALRPCQAADVEPPVAGRPGNYSGAIGSHFRVQMHATPTQLQAEDPLTLTVRISGSGNLQQVEATIHFTEASRSNVWRWREASVGE